MVAREEAGGGGTHHTAADDDDPGLHRESLSKLRRKPPHTSSADPQQT
jgi:hypothetical protein